MAKKTATKKARQALKSVPLSGLTASQPLAKTPEQTAQEEFVEKKRIANIVEYRRDTQNAIILLESQNWEGRLVSTVAACIKRQYELLKAIETQIPADVLKALVDQEKPKAQPPMNEAKA